MSIDQGERRVPPPPAVPPKPTAPPRPSAPPAARTDPTPARPAPPSTTPAKAERAGTTPPDGGPAAGKDEAEPAAATPAGDAPGPGSPKGGAPKTGAPKTGSPDAAVRKAGTAFAEAEAEAADVASPGAARPTARRAAAPAAATPAKTGSPKAGPRDAGAAEAGAAEAASPGGGPAGGQSKAAAPPEGRAAKATAAGAASAAAGPRAIQAPAPPSVPPPPAVPPAPADESPPTLLLRAVTVPRRAAPHRLSARLVAPVVCLVLGAGLLSGAAAGAWITGDGDDPSATEAVYEDGRSLWRDVPVDRLFPAELAGEGAGPGGADRRWLRVGVAPDGDCDQALDPLLAEVLAAVGCHRLVRATYVDETETSVTTVGLLFTNAAESAMRQMKERFRTEGLAGRPDLMPRAYAPPGTVAEGFGDEQRYSWTVRVLAEMPVVVYAVTGFVDGRTATYPQPAAEATAEGEETTVALAGLGHDAEGIADRVQSGLHRAADEAGEAGGADGWEPR